MCRRLAVFDVVEENKKKFDALLRRFMKKITFKSRVGVVSCVYLCVCACVYMSVRDFWNSAVLDENN